MPPPREALPKVADLAKRGSSEWRDWVGMVKGGMNLSKDELGAVLKVQRAMARSSGETPSASIKRLFRGILPEEQWHKAIPGVRAQTGRRGIVDISSSGKGLIGISSKTLAGSGSDKMQTILHEMAHVYFKGMPKNQKAGFYKVLGKRPGVPLTRVDEHKFVRWFLEFLKMGYSPHPSLNKAFSTFYKSMGELHPFQMGSGVSAKRAMAPELGHIPKEALVALESLFKGGGR